MFNLIF